MKIGEDKYTHFAVGTPLSTLIIIGGIQMDWDPLLLFGLYVLALIGFEMYQKKSGTGTFDWWDVVAGALPYPIIWLIYTLIMLIV